MIHAADAMAQLWLGVLADWSVRWGSLLLILWLWFLIRAPGSAALRYLLLCVAMAVGLALPLAPRWGPGVFASAEPAPSRAVPVKTPPPPTEVDSRPLVPASTISERSQDSRIGSVPSRRRSEAQRLVPPPGRPAETPVDWLRVLRVSLLGLWIGGVLLCVARLLVGWAALARLRRQSVPLAGASTRQFDQIRAELRLSRRPVLAMHPAVRSPILIGGLRPAVLVPTDWEELPSAAQRTCLLHELAHLARLDDWMRLLLEVVRAIFFFHPLVHWLVGRCRYEQELLCDERVVHRGIDRTEYARTLLDFSRRLAEPKGTARWAGQSLPFLNRATVKTRIRRLMEEPMFATGNFSRRRLVSMATLAGIFALAVTSVRLTAVEPSGEKPTVQVKASQADSSPEPVSAPEADSEATPDSAMPKDEELNKATTRAIDFLRGAQNGDGSWSMGGQDRWRVGSTSLCILALLRSGVGAGDPQIKKALDWLESAEPPKMVYEISLQTLVFCAADPRRYQRRIQRNVELLETAQIAQGENRGGWSYSVDLGGFLDLGGDNSNSEFAVWALGEADRAGAKIDAEMWRRAYEYWRDGQNDDGSWSYTAGRNTPGTGSMTTSGIASIAIAADRLTKADKDFEPEGGPVARGWDWMAKNFAVGHNPGGSNWLFYYLMMLRRAGDLTGRNEVGRHDWYREGKEFLLHAQDKTGAWNGIGSIENDPLIATSMALLFLNREPKSAEAE